MKEMYLKPEITSEILEPDTLLVAGSAAGSDGGGGSGPWQILWPLFGFCCD